MKYRGVEYTVVQGIGRHVWKWSVSLDTGVSVGGRTAIKSEAVAEAERAIDRALAPKKLRLVQPNTERGRSALLHCPGIVASTVLSCCLMAASSSPCSMRRFPVLN